MPDRQHLDWLKDGFEAWNRRRRDAPFTPDFSDADLSGRSLWRYNFRGAVFRRADLSEATLRDAELEGADLAQANLFRADLRGAKPERASFHRATLRLADLRRCDLRGARLDGADLTHAKLAEADLRGADLRAWTAPQQHAPRNAFEAKFRTEPVPVVTITQRQLDAAMGDGSTLLAEGLAPPPHWSVEVTRAALRLKATPAAEFTWREDGRLGAVRLQPIPPTPQTPAPANLNAQARDQQLASVGRLAERIAASLESYDETRGHNLGAIGRTAAVPLRMIAEECQRPADEVLIAFVRANIGALTRLQAEDAEALADVDRVLLAQLLEEWRLLAPFFPVLAEIDNPSNVTLAPAGSENASDAFVADVLDAVNSEAAREILSDETRYVFAAESGSEAPATPEGKKDRLVRVASITAALKHALDEAPKPVKRLAAFTGFAATVKELVDLVGWIFL